MYRIDLSEYKEGHTVARLIGSPPGYVGHDDGGQLTERIMRNPFQLVLMDEIDKTHESVHDILLSILDAGRLTDGKGRVADFSQSIIVLTSNLGAATAQKMLERNPDVDYGSIDAAVRADIHDFYVNRLGRPELYGRLMDSLVVFDFIRKDAQVKLLRKKLYAAADAIRLSSGIGVSGLEIAESYLVSRLDGYIMGGGRGIVKLVEKHFLEPVANLIYERDIQSGMRFQIANCLEGASRQTEIVLE
jgi:ATP-dependent Clp protease ATP-binding subunit ClpA